MGLIVGVGVDLGQRDETLSLHGEAGCWAGHRLLPPSLVVSASPPPRPQHGSKGASPSPPAAFQT